MRQSVIYSADWHCRTIPNNHAVNRSNVLSAKITLNTYRKPYPTKTMDNKSVGIVHGFAVTSFVFRPLLARLRCRSLDATLFRYPSVGLSLPDIIARLASNLREKSPDGIIAHSLGCIATSLAVHKTDWRGPIVFLAPPFSTLPATRMIPRFIRWPFAPLLDHRSLTSASNYRPPVLSNCPTKSIVGRFDYAVPMSCSRSDWVDESCALKTQCPSIFRKSE